MAKIFNKICQKCGKGYRVPNYRINKSKYCSKFCCNSARGIIGGSMGKGISRNKGIKRPYVSIRNRLFPNIGNKNGNWKGGISPVINNIRRCLKYRQWVSDVFTRDDFTCMKCNIRGGNLEAHHIKSFSDIIKENNIDTFEKAMNCEELWNLNNGETLHILCHNDKHKK